MLRKLFKKSPNSPTNHPLSGISTNAALDHSDCLAGLDVNPEDGQGPRPSQTVLCERESGVQRPIASETSTFTVNDTGSENPPQREDTDRSRQEGGLGTSYEDSEQDRRDPELRVPSVLTGVSEEAPNGFTSLEELLESIFAVYANREESVAVRNKVEVLLPRITSLGTLFASLPGDVGEMSRRDDVISKLKGIECQLRSQCEKLGFLASDCIQLDEDLFGSLEDLQEAIFGYQVARRTTIYDQGINSIEPAEAAVLNNFRYAKRAEYRHNDDRNGCLRGTRRTVLDEIELWTRDFGEPPIYWLNGLAGTGKTAIAQTIAERAFAEGLLGASFFCSRDFEDRSNLKFIFPTLAVQLARKYSEFRSTFVPLVRSDPEIADESLYNQMKKLIVQPLTNTTISILIVIDALDECKDDSEEPASAILSVLGQFVSQIPNVKLLVTGRPEPRVLEGFRLPLLAKVTDVFVLHEVDPAQINSDVRLFFISKLKGFRRGSDDWPTEEQLDLLCRRAEGLFVYAVATVRFICQRNSNPKKQLDRLLGSPESSVFEGKIKFRTNSTLDSLYASILQEAFGDDDPEDDPKIRSVLGAVVLSANPLSPSTIATLLDLDPEDVSPLVLSVHSLLILQEEDINHPVRPFHKSFPDFIVDSVRCANPRFRVCSAGQHGELLVGCLDLMNQRLKWNMCGLPDGVINSEVGDLKERAEEHIDQALRYSCRSWHKHLVAVTPSQALKIVPALHRFLEEKFLFWLEVLSVLGAARVAVDALEAVSKLVDASSTLNIIRDYLRFVVGFFEVIDTSAQHIYHSALPLSPRTSIVRELYERHARPFVRVVRGLPISWEPAIATVYCEDTTGVAAWSPDNRLLAVASYNSVEILEAGTLKRLNTFGYFQHRQPPTYLHFSPDSRLLAGFSNQGLSIWDLQTGGPVGSSPQGLSKDEIYEQSATYSVDGKLLAVGYVESDRCSYFIATYDLLSRTRVSSHRVSEGLMVTPIWTHGESLRFVTVKPGSITIWEVGFTLTQTPAEIKSLPTPDKIAHMYESFFLPHLSIIALVVRNKVLIWDTQESKLVLDFVSPGILVGLSFSSDGRTFACGGHGRVHVWKDSPAGYTLHRTLEFSSPEPSQPVFSPNGESLITVDQSNKIRLWPMISFAPSPLSDVQVSPGYLTNILEFSPDSTLAAVGLLEENTVEIVDLKSGDRQLVIDVGMDVYCLRVTETTVVVISKEKQKQNKRKRKGRIITWTLPAGDRDAEASIDDSVQTTALDHPRSSHPFHSISISPDAAHVAILDSDNRSTPSLRIYDGSTGEHLTSTTPPRESGPLFTPDGCEVWLVDYTGASGWKIVKDGEAGVTDLDPLESTACPIGIRPWETSRGYEVTHDGWVLSSAQKRLLWLPHHWRSDERSRTWSGQFLGLRISELPEFVILEFLK